MGIKPKVKLVQYTPEPEKTVAMAAKLCYSSVGINDIEQGLTEEKTAKFLDMLMSFGHQSPIEHVSFTFAIEGVSRTLTHQLVRHRIASYSQQSQRYVREGQFEYIIPPEIENNKEASELFIEAMQSSQNYYDKIAALLVDKHYKTFLDSGMNEKQAKQAAEKKGIEDARFVLPNATETKIIVTMNARTLLNFFNHRCCSRAQWEIRNLADEMLRLVKEVAPILFKNAGPSCVKGTCPEGKMTCGKANAMKEKYLR